ncbi:hypothetical protein SUGI_1172040 [Cryptomeria japonica]|uniref:probable calcium-binding protein CML23 n=1 Tax=Cryptomeria japonica TaxID=3369 RepID=UPI0024149BC7|nr:probable calcium-binding protein CML23 [Cryptomeria japonica]GLJ54568.1 hypothetical protein SUGI_1172040 [Cryptomeria japonica]
MRFHKLFFGKFVRLLKKLIPTPSKHNKSPLVKPAQKNIDLSPSFGILAELEKVFRHFDANGDGKISVSELGAVINSLEGTSNASASHEELEMMIKEVDSDGDGFIDLQEFIAFNIKSEGGGVGSLQELRDAFRIFDRDRNGYISAEELRSVLTSVGDTCSFEDCLEMIKGIDSDGDGYVNFEEFRTMMTSSCN